VAVTSAGCSKQEDTADAHRSRASDYFAAGQYDKAEKEYRDVLRLAPDDRAALHQLGLILQDQGQYPQAYPLLKKAAELAPDDLEVQLKLGLTLQALKQYKEAREAALHVLDKQPGHEQALQLLANTALGLNDVDEMRKYIEDLRGKDQDRAGYHLALALLDLRQNDRTAAENEIKAALALDPKSVGVLTAMADLYWGHNDLPAAEQEFKAAADLSPPRSPAWLRYADFKLRTEAVKEAKEILQNILQKAPDYLPAQATLMKLACTENEKDCAERVQAVLTRDPINFDALFQDGLISISKDDAQKAIREFEYLSHNYTQNAPVHFQLARAYLELAKTASPVNSRNAIDAAETNLDAAIKLDPKFDPATLALAGIKLSRGNPPAALDLLAPLVKERPQIAQAQYLLATVYLAQQQPDQALAVYRQMTELFPKDPQPPFLIGRMLIARKQQPQARQEFEKSLEISPNYLPATEMLVDLDLADKQYAAAMDRVQKLLDKDPKQAQVWAMRGKIYLAQRDFAHAEPDLLKAAELDPKLEPAYLLLAQAYVASNKQNEAIEKLTAFIDKNKDEASKAVPALLQLAMIQQSLQHFDDARDAYEKVLTVNPNLASVLNNLAALYSDNLGQLDKAYDLAKKAREAAPNDPHIADTLGWILYKKGDYDNALPLLQDGAGKLPGDPVIQFHLGMAQYMLGAAEPARLALQHAADATADFSGKNEARRRLALLAIDVQTANAADLRTQLENYLHDQPNDPEALLRLGELQEREGALDQAAKTYEKIVDVDSLFAPALRRVALLYGQRPADETKAYDLASRARRAYPTDPDIARVLGILNYRRGYYPQSVELLKEAAAKQSDNAELFYYLGEASYQLKQWSNCDGALKRAISLNLSPKLADQANGTLAECSAQRDRSEGIQNYQRGDYAKSAELLKDAATKRKDDPELLYYLGQTYHRLKQLNECKDTLQRALNLGLSPQLTDEAKQALADCSQTSSQ
jgi:tetratricopeptide (TPR) repeat protein